MDPLAGLGLERFDERAGEGGGVSAASGRKRRIIPKIDADR